MNMTDILAIGSCYVDTNVAKYPFSGTGIPVETELIGGDYELVAGGSAVNFCRLLQELSVSTTFIGMAGQDSNGDVLASLLEAAGITSALIRQPQLSTNVGFNMTNPDGEHILLIAGTANAALSPEVVIPKLEDAIAETRLLYLGGCFKLTLLRAAFPRIAEMAAQTNTILAVDHGRIPRDASADARESVKRLVRSSTYYLPSREEFCQLWETGAIEEGLRLLHERAPDLTVIVKDGANGAFYLSDSQLQHVPSRKLTEIVQATGAGDSFNAGVISAIVDGRSLMEAVTYGCAVAAARVGGQAIPQLG